MDVNINAPTMELAGLGAGAVFQPYTYAATHSSIAAGVTQEGSIKIDGDSAFVIDSRLLNGWIVSSSGSSIAGTPLARDAMADSAGNELPALRFLTVQVTVNARRLSNIPIAADLWTGDGRNPGYPLRKIWVPAGATLSYAITNGSAIAVGVFIAFDGARVYPK